MIMFLKVIIILRKHSVNNKLKICNLEIHNCKMVDWQLIIRYAYDSLKQRKEII